ncbi:MAG: 3-dehydroquinate synthase [Clostridia bacterium]
MERLQVNAKSRSYEIVIDFGLLMHIAAYIKEIYAGQRIFIITDTNVEKLYAEKIVESLLAAGYEVEVHVVAAGEQSKSLLTLEQLYYAMYTAKLTRSDLIMALGGGVIGDLAGYAAATYLRGMLFVQIPTTLLAQIDSSIGGKVAVNLSVGKNLVGNFYQPIAVLSDTACLQSLPERVFNDGMGELIKYGCIWDAKMLDQIEDFAQDRTNMKILQLLIKRCCEIKAEIVVQDELDKGIRMLLNFGHTLGHAIEKTFNYETYTHGEAIAIGMCMITQISEAYGLTEVGAASRIEKLCRCFNLPSSLQKKILLTVISNIQGDKKTLGNNVNFVLLEQLGKAILYPVALDDLEIFLLGGAEKLGKNKH